MEESLQMQRCNHQDPIHIHLRGNSLNSAFKLPSGHEAALGSQEASLRNTQPPWRHRPGMASLRVLPSRGRVWHIAPF